MIKWNRRDAPGKGHPADDEIAGYLTLLEDYAANGEWEPYLDLAGKPAFQADVAAWTVRNGQADGGPLLGILETALGQAVQRSWIGDAAALTLASARWSRWLSVRTALGTPDTGGPGASGPGSASGRGSGKVDVSTGPDVLRALLRAWDLFDDGNPGAARDLLSAVVSGQPSLVRTSDGARWASPLLGQALAIAPEDGQRLLDLVDDNVLGDLARELTQAGDFARARIAGSTMRLFHATKADILADLALTQAAAALRPEVTGTRAAELRAAAEAANLAAEALDRALEEETSGAAGRLAKVAAALTLAGEVGPAARRWAEAMAAGEQDPDPHRTLADFAQAQVRAGMLDDAAQVIAVLLDGPASSADDWMGNAARDPAWQAAAALIGALAERGEEDQAAALLRLIPEFAHCHARAVRGLARAIAGHDPTAAERLAGQVRDSTARGWVLAAVAETARAAGHAPDALRIARAIEDLNWRAQALVDAAREAGQADGVPGAEVSSAVAKVSDDATRARLLAAFALTQGPAEQERLLADAVRQAERAPRDDRWSALAEIGDVQAKAGHAAAARQTFDAALRLLAKDARSWDRELLQLAQARLQAGDTAGTRATIAVALSALPGRRATRRLGSAVGAAVAPQAQGRPVPARAPADDQAIAAAQAAADVPIAVAALASIAVALAATATDPPDVAATVETILARAERLADGLTGASRVLVDDTRVQARTALGDFTAAEQAILDLLPPPDPGPAATPASEGEDDDDDRR